MRSKISAFEIVEKILGWVLLISSIVFSGLSLFDSANFPIWILIFCWAGAFLGCLFIQGANYNNGWDRHILYEFKRRRLITIFMAILFLLGIYWGFRNGLTAILYLILGWFTALIAFELSRIQRGRKENAIAMGLICCIFLGVVIFVAYNDNGVSRGKELGWLIGLVHRFLPYPSRATEERAKTLFR